MTLVLQATGFGASSDWNSCSNEFVSCTATVLEEIEAGMVLDAEFLRRFMTTSERTNERVEKS
jgi:hypothetical protein